MAAENIPVRLLIQLALGQFTASTAIARTAGLALISAAAGVANVDGMRESSTTWQELANQLELVKRGVNEAVATAKDGWIADDRQEFTRAMDRYLTELDDLKSYMSDAGKAMDTVHDVYRALWMALGAFATALFAALLVLFALFFVPYVGPLARVAAEALGNIAARLVDVMVKGSAAILSAISGLVGAGAAAGIGNFGLPEPIGGKTGKEDLQAIVIDYHAPSTYVMPKRDLPELPTP